MFAYPQRSKISERYAARWFCHFRRHLTISELQTLDAVIIKSIDLFNIFISSSEQGYYQTENVPELYVTFILLT